MHKRLQVKLYPTEVQKQTLKEHFDAYRYCYNLCLEYKQHLYKYHKINVSGYDMAKELLVIRKEVDFLKRCKAECIREAAYVVDKSYINFFNGGGYPKFKNKHNRQSFSAYQSIKVLGNRVKFYGKYYKFKTSEKYFEQLNNHKIKQITFIKEVNGSHYATFLIETKEDLILPKSNNTIAFDLGIADLLITSEGEYFENKKFMQNEQFKLRHFQRKFAKTKKGGKNREKLRLKINKIYDKIAKQREHYYHQTTNQLIRENQTIIMESLKIQQMNKNKNLSYSIQDVSWGLFTQMLEYKCKWYGRELIKVDQYFPSSKMCSNCGNVKEELKLSQRQYECEKCSLSLQRDYNSSLNILQKGLEIKQG